jgi:hypothetical protein
VSDLATVTFGDNQNTWVAHPNTTNTTTESAIFTTAGVASSTNLLGLSDTGSVACPVIFTSPTSQANNNTVTANTSVSTPQTNVWTLYGKYVMCSQDNVNFYAQPTGQDGWYNLLWSATADAALTNIPVTLRPSVPPLAKFQHSRDVSLRPFGVVAICELCYLAIPGGFAMKVLYTS